jgi:hypothetical protein
MRQGLRDAPREDTNPTTDGRRCLLSGDWTRTYFYVRGHDEHVIFR